ncbi:MAG TPA: hypothetical protein VF041_08000 [Gemmatimonadaceae bacterium]
MGDETHGETRRELSIDAGGARLTGSLVVPARARAVALFAHEASAGHDASAPPGGDTLRAAGFATLHFDMLTPEEERTDERTGHLRFDVELLASRVMEATRAVRTAPETLGLPIGYVGGGTGAAAVLRAVVLDRSAYAVVGVAGRPDLALDCLPKVRVPTLLIVGGADVPLVPLNEQAFEALACEKELVTLPGAGHRLEEPGALDTAARLTTEWLARRLPAR